MLKNRSLQIKMVKDGTTSSVDTQPIDYHDLAKTITKSAIAVIAFYVGADTCRRAAIYFLSSRI